MAAGFIAFAVVSLNEARYRGGGDGVATVKALDANGNVLDSDAGREQPLRLDE